MFSSQKNMRFYNVLLNDKFCINVDHFKLIYSVLEIIYVFYIDENYCFITFKNILKKLMKIFLFSWIFDTFLKISKIPQFFAPKHAVLQRTLKWWFFHQRGALQAGIHVSRVNIYAPYCRKSFFLSFLHIFEKFQKIFKQISWIFDNFLKICWNFDFFEFHSPYLWVKKCALWVRAHKNFFVSKLKCIYLKIFCIIISLDTTVAIVQAINRVCTHIILAKLAILSNLWPLPPQHGKKWGEIFFPSGVQYFSYKNFLDLCMKFFLNTFLGATLMYSQFLRHA